MTESVPDIGIESGNEDHLFYAEKDWRRLEKRSLTTGYREGLDHAADEALQQGFDRAYVEGYKTGLENGKLGGRTSAIKLISQKDQSVK